MVLEPHPAWPLVKEKITQTQLSQLSAVCIGELIRYVYNLCVRVCIYTEVSICIVCMCGDCAHVFVCLPTCLPKQSYFAGT